MTTLIITQDYTLRILTIFQEWYAPVVTDDKHIYILAIIQLLCNLITLQYFN